jgi:ABC-type glycerol-3-phosphate transport system substrate-binding protein
VTGKIPEHLANPDTGLAWTDSNPSRFYQEINGEHITGVYTPSSGKTTFKITVKEAGMYSVDINYLPVENFDYNEDGVAETVSTKTTIERMFYIDGVLPFNECRYLYIPRSWEYVGTDGTSILYRIDEPKRDSFASDAEYEAAHNTWAEATGGSGNYVWDLDIQDNDIRPDRIEASQLRTYFIRDWLGYTVEPFQFYLTEGDHYLTFEATREPLVISDIRVYGYKAEDSYDYQLQRWLGTGIEIYTGDDAYIIEAESPIRVSDQCLFPGTDRTSCINSPSHPANLVYNISNSSVVGQYMTYKVYVKEEGLYNIMARFRQNTRAGMFSSRRIRINGDIQFREASFLRFNYDTSFQNVLLGNGEQDYLFYFKEGWNTVEVEVVLGDMAAYIYDIAAVINKMTSSYQKILQITGTNPDTGRDYMFASLIPDVIGDLAESALELDRIYNALVETTGATGQHIATLDTIRQLVARMAVDEYEIAPNFLSFKNYITSLQNWLYTSLSQPLKLDHLLIQSPEKATPRAKPTVFYAAYFEAKAFFASFFKDYNVIGFKTDKDANDYEGTILMWNTTSREDALILRTMIDSSFTPQTNIAMNIRYVAQGLQESVLAGVGPDVAMMASGTAVNWGLRSGVEKLSSDYTQEDADKGLIPEGKSVGDEKYEGFDVLCPRGEDGEFITPYYNEEKGKFMDITGTTDTEFSHAALEAVSLDGITYLLPCTMNFEMSFYRIDIFAKYDLKPPRTWQELYEILPTLTTQHMTMGMQTSLAGYQMLLYQMGETMYASDYQEFNQSTTCLAAFDTLCALFNDYSLPISYDLTRFRTGEIPIVVANWTTYNSFMDYYELRGLWTMESLIGWEHEDGHVDRSSILNVEGIVIPRGSDNPQHVWKYMKWYAGFDTQKRLARQRLATASNTTEKYNSANLNALLEQAWTSDELAAIKEQIPHLKGLPFNPGDYNIGRYVNFAFLAVYNSNANAVDSLLNYVVDINKELSRKREEYHLPFIDYYG